MALQGALSFFAGYACSSGCSNLPCRTRFADRGRSFKLSILIHNASLHENAGPGLVQNERPFVTITAADKKKETELGDWSKEKSQWCFREVITVEVNMAEEVSVVVDASKRYNLYVASVSVQNHRVGELCFPVGSVLNRLHAEDRDTDGLVYATPVMGFDITREGKVTGKVYLSFETKNPPSSLKRGDADRCCGLTSSDSMMDSGYHEYRCSDDDSTTCGSYTRVGDIGSDTDRWGPRFANRENEMPRQQRDAHNPRSPVRSRGGG